MYARIRWYMPGFDNGHQLIRFILASFNLYASLTAMAICAVFGCNSNNTKKLKRNSGGITFKLFRFPRNEEIAGIWQSRCRRNDRIHLKTSYICSRHFSKQQYARNLRYELLGYSPKCQRRLKENAVPDENLPEKAEDFVFQAVSVGGEEDITDAPSNEIVKPLLSNLVIEFVRNDVEAVRAECDIAESHQEVTKDPCPKQNRFTPKETGELEIIKKEKKISEMSSQVTIRTLGREIEQLKSQMVTLLEENVALKATNKNLAEQNGELMQENSMLARIFTPKQREKMRRGGRRLNWTLEDISRSVVLYYNGPQAYDFLLQQGYPLPAKITLQKWLAKKRDPNIRIQNESVSENQT